MKHILLVITVILSTLGINAANPVEGLLERIQPGASSRFILTETGGNKDYFEISSKDGKPAITANNTVNLAAGLNWYLKHYANVHLTWNNMTANLPMALPLPSKPERHDTSARWRYYLNYCTHSYSMAFWDWERWEREIDWMALHGINMPLAMTGMDVVWRNTLRRLGYNEDEINNFVAGPAFQAWWLMNNLEGWGGPNTPEWYDSREKLQKQILARMKEYGMSPVLPGYSGMLPHDAGNRLGVTVSGEGIWNGFVRPVFLKSDDPQFNRIADIYYDEMTRLYGPADFYSMDPFHEGGSLEGVDLREAGAIITQAMKRANPRAVWVIQGWRENPRRELLNGVMPGDLLVLDLASEIRPQWGDPESPAPEKRPEGYAPHQWAYCMLLNFGGNVGLHGRMDYLIDEYYKAKASPHGRAMTGVGLTMEGIENNPVMYELMSELMWIPEKFSKEDWLRSYLKARYGADNKAAYDAWVKLANSIYNCPPGNLQQGTSESVFCARPATDVYQVSSWSRMEPYYDPRDVILAAGTFVQAAPALRDNANFRYDIVDIVRQAVSERGRLTYEEMIDALNSGDSGRFDDASERFLNLIKAQDMLLATTPAFKVGTWINDARNLAPTPAERDKMEWNARLLVTTWGPRVASEDGGLRDYSHREWAGLLGDLYHRRWKLWIDSKKRELAGEKSEPIDFYAVDESWVTARNPYSHTPVGDPVDMAVKIFNDYVVR